LNELLRSDLFGKAIAATVRETRASVQVVAPSTISFLDEYEVPGVLWELLTEHSYDRPFQIGNIYFYQTNELADQNLEPQNFNCIRSGLLIVGCGLNGDPVIINMKTLNMGFVFHDRLWGEPSVDALSICVDTGLSIGEFYSDALARPDRFPADAYEAEEIYGPAD
jgi:hypothetical protein